MHTLNLLSPLKIGDLFLSNRMIMTALTRTRASDDFVPTDLMLKYYSQRATAGLIITEGTIVDRGGIGYANTPGIWSEEQVLAWRKIVNEIHSKRGKIFLQLWHVGRISHSLFLDGQLPIAPSPIPANDYVSLVRPKKAFEIPHALTTHEISKVIEMFHHAAMNAKRAGFDGVVIHAGNGYLLDQFLRDYANKRNDKYGGSIENRARLILEIVDAVKTVWDANRVGVNISTRNEINHSANDMADSNPLATFSYLCQELGKRKIAFILNREYQATDGIGKELKKIFGGIYIANEKFDFISGDRAINDGTADAIGFGRLFISNPDLPQRYLTKSPLNPERPEFFFHTSEEGYIDYPAWC
jgi:2,4-dienoyl-CoA reductase-like NADH-dependent reductase (Old Yellow Enzyme family)